MQESQLSYDVIKDYFGKEAIADRYRYLYDKMQKYIDERKWQDGVIISEDILHQTVMDYFADVYRLKMFHKIENINMTKIIAYEVFWIVRRKPIQNKHRSSDSRMVFANEGFATTFIAQEYLMPEVTEPRCQEKEEAFLKYLQHIFYHLKYRCVDKQCIELMLYSFETGKYIA